MQELITKVAAYVEKCMSKYDGSHDFDHIKRVVGLAHHIHSQMTTSPPKSNIPSPPLDLDVITLAALLHDIGDRKYIEEGQDEKTMVRELLLGLGASPELAARVQTICLGVSYSSEIKDFDHVVGLIARHPELAVVQKGDQDLHEFVPVNDEEKNGEAGEEPGYGDTECPHNDPLPIIRHPSP